MIMAPWLQRLVTIATGIACFVVGHYVPEAQKPLYMAGAALVFWAIPHTADVKSLGASIPEVTTTEETTAPIVPPKKAA